MKTKAVAIIGRRGRLLCSNGWTWNRQGEFEWWYHVVFVCIDWDAAALCLYRWEGKQKMNMISRNILHTSHYSMMFVRQYWRGRICWLLISNIPYPLNYHYHLHKPGKRRHVWWRGNIYFMWRNSYHSKSILILCNMMMLSVTELTNNNQQPLLFLSRHWYCGVHKSL